MNILQSVINKAAKELVDKYKMEDVGQMFVGFGTALLRVAGKTREDCLKIVRDVWDTPVKPAP
jgi:hypothetical protein